MNSVEGGSLFLKSFTESAQGYPAVKDLVRARRFPTRPSPKPNKHKMVKSFCFLVMLLIFWHQQSSIVLNSRPPPPFELNNDPPSCPGVLCGPSGPDREVMRARRFLHNNSDIRVKKMFEEQVSSPSLAGSPPGDVGAHIVKTYLELDVRHQPEYITVAYNEDEGRWCQELAQNPPPPPIRKRERSNEQLDDLLLERSAKLIAEGRFDDGLEKRIWERIDDKAFEQKVDELVQSKILRKLSKF